jgi:hypothetical protein
MRDLELREGAQTRPRHRATPKVAPAPARSTFCSLHVAAGAAVKPARRARTSRSKRNLERERCRARQRAERSAVLVRNCARCRAHTSSAPG